MTSTLKHPSAWIPIALSLTVIAAWIISILVAGEPQREPDEGVAAHLFQMWLLVEVILIAFFAIKWLPLRPREALFVLALQIVAVIAACFPVHYFNV